MKSLRKTVNAVIFPDDPPWFVAECQGINVVTQGKSLDEVVANLKEAVALFFEGEDAEEFGYVENPSIVITYVIEEELAPA